MAPGPTFGFLTLIRFQLRARAPRRHARRCGTRDPPADKRRVAAGHQPEAQRRQGRMSGDPRASLAGVGRRREAGRGKVIRILGEQM